MNQRRDLAGIHVATLLFGVAGLFARWVHLPSTHIVLGRTAFACLFLFFLLRLEGQSLRLPRWTTRGVLALSGMLLAFHWFAFFRSIQLASVAVALLSFSCFPIFLVLLEPLLFRERFRSRALLLVGLMILGVFLIMPVVGGKVRITPGLAWGLMAGFSFALLILQNRALARRHSGFVIAFWQDLFAFLALLPFFFLAPARPTARDLGLLLLLGIFCTAIAHSLFIHGLKRVRGQTAGLIALLEPVYAILLAWLLLGEGVHLRTLAGGFIILGAAVWVTRRPL